MKSRFWVLLTVVALVIATTVVMTNAVTPPDYAADLTLSADNKAECPVCGTEQTWTVLTADSALTDVQSGEHRHYYVKDSITNNTKNAANHFLDVAGGTVCLHLGGSGDVMTIGSFINMKQVENAATLNVFGSGKLVGTCSAYGVNRRGAAISNESTYGNVNIYSGTIASTNATYAAVGYSLSKNASDYTDVPAGVIRIMDAAVINGAGNSDAVEINGGRVVLDGGTINGRVEMTSLEHVTGTGYWMKPAFTMEDGVINGIGTKENPTNQSGAAVYLSYASFTMNGGIINGGYTNAVGGAIGTCIATNQKQIYIHGGTIQGGYAGGIVNSKEYGGGNIYVDGISTTKLSTLVIDGNATITGGETAKYGGNINVGHTTVTLGSGVVISGGKAETGGNVRINGSKSVMTLEAGAQIKDGVASKNGGNLSLYEAQAVIKGTLSGGSASSGGSVVGAGGTSYLYVDGGTVTGGVATTYAGNVQLNNGRAVLRNGGKILNGKAKAGAGGNVYSGGGLIRIEKTGGTISGGQALGTTTGNGGNLYMTWASSGAYLGTIDIQAGTVSAGYAQASGGNIYATNKTTVNIAGTIRNLISDLPEGATAHAKNGGNIFVTGEDTTLNISGTLEGGVASALGGGIFVDSKAKCTITGTVKNGVATTNGGNIYVCGGSELDVQGSVTNKISEIPSGKTYHAKSGGNIYANGSTAGLTKVTITGTVDGGYTSAHGGNIHFVSGALLELKDGGVIKNGKTNGSSSYGGNVYGKTNVNLNMTGGKIIDGNAQLAGNVWIEAGNFNMSGGEISGGTSNSSGQDNVRVQGGAIMTMTGGTVYGTNGAAAGTGTAICVFVNGTLRLGGNAKVLRKDGVRQGVILASTSLPRIQILNDWTGEATINVPAESYGAALPEDTDTWVSGRTGRLYQAGSVVDGAFVKGGTIQGKLYADLTSRVLLTAENGTIYIPGGEAVDADGKVSSVRDALAAYATGNYQFVRIYGGVVKMNGDLTLDVNGKTLSVEGNGKLYAFDSANDTFDATKCGKLTIDSKDVKLQGETEIGDKRYVALKIGNSHTYTMHRVEIKLLNVVLRPDVEKLSDVGYYYQATYNFDDAVKNAIDSYGVVVSKIDMPGSNFLQEAKGENGWTVMYGAPAVNATVNSGLLSNIMSENKTPEENAAAGEKIVYANPYLVVRTADDTMTVLLGDPKNAGKEDGTALSLKDVLMAADDYYKNDATVMAQLKGYYKQWASYGLELWKKDLPNIAA